MGFKSKVRESGGLGECPDDEKLDCGYCDEEFILFWGFEGLQRTEKHDDGEV